MLPKDRRDIDPIVFIATAVFVAAVAIPLLVAPEQGGRVVGATFAFLTQQLGFLYIWAAIANLAFVCWIGLGRFGKVRLSSDGSGPEFSTFSWAAMLFCAGMGTGILYWGTIEWAYYIDSPPYGAAPRSTEAIEWATAYPLFHWGVTGWALYCLPALALAYGFFVRGQPSLRLSTACRPLIGDAADGWLGTLIDLIFMVGLLGASGTGIGLAVPLISTGLARLVGIEVGFGLNTAVILVVTLIFSASVWFGLEKGIQRLSRWNVNLTLVLLAFVLVVGPTVFILDTGTNAVGHMLQNFIKMNFWTDPIDETGFVESWTIFYWAWWIALAPFMGMFVARISPGRTLREVVYVMIGIGPAG
jgi:BCCT family betaine/carnitine transporter